VGDYVKICNAAAIAAACALVAGCASIVDGSTQQVTVGSSPDGAACIVSNEVGRWPVVAPGTVTVQKSQSVLTVRCSKDGWKDGVSYAAPRMSSMAAVGAMMPYVGLIDAAVDASSGAAMKYPDTVLVILKPMQAAQAPRTSTPPSTHVSEKEQ
jgi:hypothetical protein